MIQLADPLVDAALVDAARELVERGAFGALWLAGDLTIAEAVGSLPRRPTRGTPVTDVLIALVGLEDEIADLSKAGGGQGRIRIPNTSVMSQDGTQSQRMNVTVFWVARRQQYLVLLGAVMSEGSPTIELDQEIRRRRLIEQDLAAKSLEYERINQQLEEFAYVISHDLNAPMRALRYLSSDVKRVLDIDEAGGETLDRPALRQAADAITTQTRRMSQMMIDLLEYARVGRVEEAVSTVDTRALVEAIFATLRPTTTLRLEIKGTWPTFDTVAAPLDVVLRNLAENAVKHHDLADGFVVLHADTVGRFVEFRIQDDGRGIPEEWHAAIFEPFRKVDDAHHPESSGIGLALVKKTVTVLGGSIEVVSAAPEIRGTTFVVRWPLKLRIPDDAASEFR
jgi:signal transduction histidine kinase